LIDEGGGIGPKAIWRVIGNTLGRVLLGGSNLVILQSLRLIQQF
jgi:hypothetical protein